MPPSSSEFMELERAISALRRGEFILVYDGDGREEETDLTIASEFVKPESIRTLRKEAGGLICTTLSGEVRARIGLPFMADVLRRSGSEFPVLQAISKEATKRENGWAAHVFADEFRSPGHVPLLNAVDPLLVERRGHTELTTALMLMAGLAPTATICEMMADDGRALSKQDAKAYARARNL